MVSLLPQLPTHLYCSVTTQLQRPGKMTVISPALLMCAYSAWIAKQIVGSLRPLK
jgi:hypothetical protein